MIDMVVVVAGEKTPFVRFVLCDDQKIYYVTNTHNTDLWLIYVSPRALSPFLPSTTTSFIIIPPPLLYSSSTGESISPADIVLSCFSWRRLSSSSSREFLHFLYLTASLS